MEDNSLYERIKNMGFGRQSDAEVEEQVEEAEPEDVIKNDVRNVRYGNKQKPINKNEKPKERVVEEEPEEGMYISQFI